MIRYVSKPKDLAKQNTCHAFDSDGLLNETGDKIASFRNNGIEKAYIDKDGNLSVASVNGIDSPYQVFAAGSFTTVGGDANESITVAGALASDLAFIQMHTLGAAPVTLLTAQAASGAINLVFSADPAADHIVKYQLLRASS